MGVCWGIWFICVLGQLVDKTSKENGKEKYLIPSKQLD